MTTEYEEALRKMAGSLALLIPDTTGCLSVCDFCAVQAEEETTDPGSSSKVKKCGLKKRRLDCSIP